jgi:hypothetical protein
MTTRPTFEEFKKEVMKDPAVREAYEALRPEFEALAKRIKAKIRKIKRVRIFKKK